MSTKALSVLEGPSTTTAPPGSAGRMIRHLSSLVGRIVIACLEYRLRRQTYSALSALDDRMLSDIGMHRSEINSVIHERAVERTRARYVMY